jgi:hypothetical protein
MADLTTIAALKAYLNLPTTWVKSTLQSVGDQVRANSAIYQCITAGTTASSGAGPSGTSADITDGTAHWKYLNPNYGGDDATLSRLISSVSAWFASYCDRTFEHTHWTYTLSGRGGPSIMLPDHPVTSITSVTVDGVTIPARPSVTGWGWIQDGSNKITICGATAGWPACFSKGAMNVAIAFQSGYSTIPSDLEQACIECCASWYRRRSRIDEQSKSIQGEVISFSTADCPTAAKSILDLYKRPWPRDGTLTVVTP